MGGFLGFCCSIRPWLWGGSALLGSCWLALGVPVSCPVPASSDPNPTAPGPLQEQPPQAGCPSGAEGTVFQRGGRGNILPGDAPGGAEGAAGASSASPGLPAPPAEPSGHRGSPQHPGDIGGRRGGGRGAAPAPLAQAAPSGGGLWGPAGAVSAPHGGLGGQLPAPQTHPLLPAPRRYQHFKSLPASLSLERLSLAGSGSLEEADGPAAGDGGPGQVPCRARSLEEGTDLETSPS